MIKRFFIIFINFIFYFACANQVCGSPQKRMISNVVVDYDIVYVRAPRYGDNQSTRWPEVRDPIQAEPGTDLVLLHPDGSEEILVAGGNGAVVDPYVSLDGTWIYFAKFHDLKDVVRGVAGRTAVARSGSDIYKINLETRKIVRLTFQEWTPNTGVANWSTNPLTPGSPQNDSLGYGIFNLGPCPLPGGKVIFTSSRNSFLPSKHYTFPNLQLFVMDEDGRNVEQIGHLNLGSALHPTVLTDGRVMFSSYESQGLRDKRLWGIWAIWPDGRYWEPLLSAFKKAIAFHFQTQLADGQIAVVDYYNLNNNGFGTLLAFASSLPDSPGMKVPKFSDAKPEHPSNPPVRQGTHGNGKPSYTRYSFSPIGLHTLTPFTHGNDNAAPRDHEVWVGKVTHPSAAPHNDVLVVWTPGPANDAMRPTNIPYYDGGIYLLKGGKPAEKHTDLVLVKNDPAFSEQQPRAVIPYKAIYGIDAPTMLPWLPNDGTVSSHLPAGTPFGLVGTSTFYKRDTSPGVGNARFGGLDPFNTAGEPGSNWITQGADAGRYQNADIHAVRILALEPTTHRSRGPTAGLHFFNHANERLRILGELPLRKYDANGKPVMDVDGNPDTSFLAKLPADVPFTFQTLDKDGLVLNMSQTWHQLRPGEVRTDCGGCHAHSQVGTDFARTAAARPDYMVHDVTKAAPVDVEYYRDIKPLLQRSCVQCHSIRGPAEAGLVLDDAQTVAGYENTYRRLADDPKAQYGPPPINKTERWTSQNASRYIRKFQSRRSLLIWKIFGRRLDGWTNEDHPTDRVPGDKSTFPAGANPNDADIDFVGTIMPPPGSGVPPLTAEEKKTFARWVDLGCPINRNEPGRKQYGWFLDELRPTLTLSVPRAGVNTQPLTLIRIGAYDYYSGLNVQSLSVKTNFDINGKRAGTELASLFAQTGDHIWTMPMSPAITSLGNGELTVSVKDKQGNITKIVRSFSVQEQRAQQ